MSPAAVLGIGAALGGLAAAFMLGWAASLATLPWAARVQSRRLLLGVLRATELHLMWQAEQYGASRGFLRLETVRQLIGQLEADDKQALALRRGQGGMVKGGRP